MLVHQKFLDPIPSILEWSLKICLSDICKICMSDKFPGDAIVDSRITGSVSIA